MIQLPRQTAIFLVSAIFIAYLFITPWQTLRQTDFQHNNVTYNDISAEEARFLEIKHYLPIQIPVGYLGKNNAGLYTKQYDVSRNFSVAQYALIPTILIIGTMPQLIVGDFPSVEIANALIKQHNLQIKKDFHNGVYLLKHSD